MWLYLTLASFVSFLASVFALIRFGFSPAGEFQKRGPLFVVGIVSSLAIWGFSLSKVPPPYPVENTKYYSAP